MIVSHQLFAMQNYSDKLIYQWWKELEIQIVLGTVENTKDAIHRFIEQKISIHQK